jgi:hypothetical protein
MQIQVQHIIKILEHLSPERQAEAGDFIEFLHQREQEQHLRGDFANASNAAFAKAWDNDDDAIYDTL